MLRIYRTCNGRIAASSEIQTGCGLGWAVARDCLPGEQLIAGNAEANELEQDCESR